MEIVNLVKTDDIWEKVQSLFESEKKKLSALFPNIVIEHVGSTVIPGTLTKGDVDINIRIKSEEFDRAVETLKNLYEINQPENWSTEFASFKDDSRNLGVQVTILGSSEDYFVAQREYLKEHPEAVAELNGLKEKFEGKSMDEYREAKGEFFERLNTNLASLDPDA